MQVMTSNIQIKIPEQILNQTLTQTEIVIDALTQGAVDDRIFTDTKNLPIFKIRSPCFVKYQKEKYSH